MIVWSLRTILPHSFNCNVINRNHKNGLLHSIAINCLLDSLLFPCGATSPCYSLVEPMADVVSAITPPHPEDPIIGSFVHVPELADPMISVDQVTGRSIHIDHECLGYTVDRIIAGTSNRQSNRQSNSNNNENGINMYPPSLLCRVNDV